ncbi:hypothetical protein DL765_008977 [Monosporascus sp. GIB2]|nr:hypothetical protein DL765_008977 [Monosporascus sp. GIB2]
MNNLVLVFDNQGKYKEAEGMNRQALELSQAVLGNEHPSTLARTKISEEVLGREHPDTLTSMNNLAKVLQNQGKYEEAEKIQRQALKLSQGVLGREHPSTLIRMNNLALILRNQGMLAEAEEKQQQRSELIKEILEQRASRHTC